MNYFELYCLVLSLITFEAYGFPQDLREVAQAVKETEHNYYHSDVSGYCVIKAYCFDRVVDVCKQAWLLLCINVLFVEETFGLFTKSLTECEIMKFCKCKQIIS